MSSPFDILQVDPDADEQEIERAYRQRVLETHPDQGGSPEQLKLVRDAYEQLTTKSSAEIRDVDPKRETHSPGPEGATGTADGSTATRGSAGTAGGAATGTGPASGSAGQPTGDPADSAGEETTSSSPRVEYLNYDVLADHGWELDDEDLFQKAAEADLSNEDYGRFVVQPDESVLQAAENRGYAWPFACRGGACANCAVAVTDGEIEMSIDHVLPDGMVDRGIRLSCIGEPTTDQLKVIYNVKHLPDLDELKLPADRFERARSSD